MISKSIPMFTVNHNPESSRHSYLLSIFRLSNSAIAYGVPAGGPNGSLIAFGFRSEPTVPIAA